MAASKAIRIFLHTLKEQYRLSENEVASLRTIHYPSEASITLINCLSQGIERLGSRIDELSRAAETDSVPIEEIKIEAATIQTFIEFLNGELCPIVRNSSIPQIPSEIVRPAERIASSLFPNCQIIINAVYEQNYYFTNLGERIDRMFQMIDCSDILETNHFKKDLFFLRLCLKPPCGVLNHCILGHELGHELYLKNQAIQQLSQLLHFSQDDLNRLTEQYLARFNSQAQASGSPIRIPLEQSSQYIQYYLKGTLLESAMRWVKEIYCDIVGVGIFGPAFICAQSILFLPFKNIDLCDEYYPPNRVRVQLAIKALERSDPGYGYRKYSKYDDLAETLIDPWKEFVTTHATEPDQEFFKVVFRSVYNIKDKIIESAKNALQGKYYKYSQIENEANLLKARILDGLPPNEYQRDKGEEFITANLQSILNAGWMAYLRDMQAFAALMPSVPEYEATTRFFGLLSKGIESGELQLAWNERTRRADQT